MAIPDCCALGFLPPGFHDCTLDEAAARFGYTPHRRALFAAMLDWLECWRAAALQPPIFIDGGFTTIKPEPPKDIDVVVDIRALDFSDERVCAVAGVLLDHDAMLDVHGIEVFAYHPLLVENDFRLWFSYVKPEKRAALALGDDFRKGLLRVQRW